MVNKHQGGHKQLMSEFQQKYFTKNLSNLARQVTSSCQVCKRVRAQRPRDPMAPLPDDRVAPKPVRVAPFDTVGIDAEPWERPQVTVRFGQAF